MEKKIKNFSNFILLNTKIGQYEPSINLGDSQIGSNKAPEFHERCSIVMKREQLDF